MKNYQLFVRNLQDQRGVIAVIVGILTVVLLSLVAFSIDIGHAVVVKNQLQNVSDSAALAAARELGRMYEGMSYEDQQIFVCDPSIIIPIAQSAALKNSAGGKNITINSNDVIIGRWHWNENPPRFEPTLNQPDAVSVFARRDATANGPISTFFASLLGKDTLNLTARATAALTGAGSVGPNGLPIPVGISEYWFTLYEETGYCNKPIKLHPTNTIAGCAGWHTYDDTPANAAKLRRLLIDLKAGTFTSPDVTANVDGFIFIGGDVASDFSDMKALFDYMKGLNDGVLDNDEDPNTWTTAVPVYKWDNCDNPRNDIVIKGFATVVIKEVIEAPEKTINAEVICNKVIAGRGSGSYYGTKGSIPGLVE